jgi:hypothetical protein
MRTNAANCVIGHLRRAALRQDGARLTDTERPANSVSASYSFARSRIASAMAKSQSFNSPGRDGSRIAVKQEIGAERLAS